MYSLPNDLLAPVHSMHLVQPRAVNVFIGHRDIDISVQVFTLCYMGFKYHVFKNGLYKLTEERGNLINFCLLQLTA